MIKISKLKFNVTLVLILLLSIVFMNGVCAQDTDGNEILTNSTFNSIQDLVDSANPGDSIYLEDITYAGNGSAVIINKNLTIYGSNLNNTILDADEKSNIIVISKGVNVRIHGITFINGKTSGDGGAPESSRS